MVDNYKLQKNGIFWNKNYNYLNIFYNLQRKKKKVNIKVNIRFITNERHILWIYIWNWMSLICNKIINLKYNVGGCLFDVIAYLLKYSMSSK